MLKQGHTQVVDADLAAYFDSNPHVTRGAVSDKVRHCRPLLANPYVRWFVLGGPEGL